jgi:hypothetical protein
LRLSPDNSAGDWPGEISETDVQERVEVLDDVAVLVEELPALC